MANEGSVGKKENINTEFQKVLKNEIIDQQVKLDSNNKKREIKQ